jgi:hypothetical protein
MESVIAQMIPALKIAIAEKLLEKLACLRKAICIPIANRFAI